jgi:hypothetical protein
VDWNGVESGGGEVVRPAPLRLALATGGLAVVALVAGTVAVLMTADGWLRFNEVWIGFWAFVATVWGAVAFRNLRRLLRREPLVGYDERNLYLPGVGSVGWDEVREVRMDQVGRGRSPKLLVGIYLHRPAEVLARAGLRRRLEGRMETSARRAPLAVHGFHLPIELYVLSQRLENRRRAAERTARRQGEDSSRNASGRPPNNRS